MKTKYCFVSKKKIELNIKLIAKVNDVVQWTLDSLSPVPFNKILNCLQ